MDAVSEQDKISRRRGTPIVVVPFPVGVDQVSVSNNFRSLTTASSCVHYKVSQMVLCLRRVVGKENEWKLNENIKYASIPHTKYPSSRTEVRNSIDVFLK